MVLAIPQVLPLGEIRASRADNDEGDEDDDEAEGHVEDERKDAD